MARVVIEFFQRRSRRLFIITCIYVTFFGGGMLMLAVGKLMKSPGLVGDVVHDALLALMAPLVAALVLPSVATSLHASGGSPALSRLCHRMGLFGAWLVDSAMFVAGLGVLALIAYMSVAIPLSWLFTQLMGFVNR